MWLRSKTARVLWPLTFIATRIDDPVPALKEYVQQLSSRTRIRWRVKRRSYRVSRSMQEVAAGQDSMDLTMPRLDGLAAAQELRRLPRTRHIPIILLTGYPATAIDRGALDADVDVFLTKPCLPEDLETHVRRLLESKGRT